MTNIKHEFKTGFLYGMSNWLTSAFMFSNPFIFGSWCRPPIWSGFSLWGGGCFMPSMYSYPSIWGGGFANLLPEVNIWNTSTPSLNSDKNEFEFNFDTFTTSNNTNDNYLSNFNQTKLSTNSNVEYDTSTQNLSSNTGTKYNFDNYSNISTSPTSEQKNVVTATNVASVDKSSVKKQKPAFNNDFRLNLTSSQNSDLNKIKSIYKKNKSKYQAVEAATGVPAELVCAIHWRESSCNFDTYLHNGQPLGKRSTKVPVGIYFTDWTSAAIDAIKSKPYYKQVKANNINTQYEYAERFNGLGYRKKGISSPYIWSGTNKYLTGKFIGDHKFNSSYKDTQVGVAAILDSLYQA